MARGANYGWPCFEGNLPNVTYQDDRDVRRAPAGAVTFPFVTYDH